MGLSKGWLAPLSACALCLTAMAAPAAAEQGLWEREKLTGDWGGARANLSDRGIEVGLAYIGETLRISNGGLRPGTAFEGRLDGTIDTDLEKLLGWKGARTHIRGFQTHKASFNAADLVGSLADPSNIDATPTTLLFTAWFQQEFGKAGSIRIGQLAADDEFLVSTTAGGLINGTFGWATVMAENMPSGGPAYPLAAPGVRLQVNPTESFSILAAVFGGDPAGKRCLNDPNLDPQKDCNKHGTTFSLDGGAFWIGEAQYQVNQDKKDTGLAAAYKVGGWYHTGNKFADQHFGTDPATGAVITLAASPVDKLYHGSNWGLYGVIDQMIWRSNGRSVSFFVRGGLSPSDRNLVSRYVDGGLGFKGLIAGRPDDTLTVGVAHSKISKDAAALDLDTLIANGPPNFIRNAETVFEASYVIQLAPWWSVQPDVQYIKRPGGNVVHPYEPWRPVGNAWVLGARSTINF